MPRKPSVLRADRLSESCRQLLLKPAFFQYNLGRDRGRAKRGCGFRVQGLHVPGRHQPGRCPGSGTGPVRSARNNVRPQGDARRKSLPASSLAGAIFLSTFGVGVFTFAIPLSALKASVSALTPGGLLYCDRDLLPVLVFLVACMAASLFLIRIVTPKTLSTSVRKGS